MNQRLVITAVILASFVVAVWFMDPFLLMVLSLSGLFWIGIPLLCVGGIGLFLSVRRGRPISPGVRIVAIVAAFGCFVGLAIPANRYVSERAVIAAKKYPVLVAPLLENYRSAYGIYPTSLGQFPTKPDVPRLLRKKYGYMSDGNSYTFSFSPPGGLIDIWIYSSERKIWDFSS